MTPDLSLADLIDGIERAAQHAESTGISLTTIAVDEPLYWIAASSTDPHVVHGANGSVTVNGIQITRA